MNKKIKDCLDYYNSGESCVPQPNDIIICQCGRKIKVKHAKLQYYIDPITNLVLPPKYRKYWCDKCVLNV